MKTVSLFVPEETIASCVAGAIDLFDKVNDYLREVPNQRCAGFNVELVSLHSRHVQLNNIAFSCHRTISEVKQTDIILLPPIYGAIPEILEKHSSLIPWLQTHYLNPKTEIATMCTGAFLLGASGLVDGKSCSTHWHAQDAFKQMFPYVKLTSHRIITDEDRIYTSGGASSFYNLLVYIVEKHCGKEVAIWIAKMMMIDIDKTLQSPFMIFTPQKDHNDKAIIAAQEFIEQHYQEELSVEEVAHHAGLSKRNFVRRFKKATHNTPIQYIQRVRVEAAKKGLEMTSDTVTEVMYDTGYSDMKSFRQLFKKITGLTPVAYRQKYSYARP